MRVGLIAPFEGLHRDLGYDVLTAVSLAVEERNAAGGVGGRVVEVIALNDNGVAEQAAQQVDKLAADSLVVGLVGPPLQAEADAVAERARQQAMPLVSLALHSPAPGSVSVAARPDDAQQALLSELRSALWQQAILLRSSDLPDTSPLVQLFTTTLSQAGTNIASDTAHSANVIYLGTVDQADGVLANGSALWLGGPDLDDPLLRQRAAQTFARGRSLHLYPPLDPARPQAASFMQRFQQKAGHAPDARAGAAYDAVSVLLDALVATSNSGVGTPRRAAVAQALPQIGREGVSGRIEFDSSGLRIGHFASVVKHRES